jgi:O-antigen ligase
VQAFSIPLVPLYLIWAFRSLVSRRPLSIPGKLFLPIGLLLMSVILSILNSPEWLYGVFDLFALIGSFLLFLFAAGNINRREEVKRVLVVLMCVMALEAVIAIGQHLTGSTLGLEFFGAQTGVKQKYLGDLSSITRVGGTFGHPNQLALFFDMLLPLGFSLLFVPMGRVLRLSLMISIGLGLLGLGATLSRGGMAGVGFAVLVLFLVHWCQRLGLFRAALATTAICTTLILLILGTSNPIQKRLVRDDYREALARIPVMKVALRMIGDRPFIGVGLNNYTSAAKNFDNTPEQITSSWNAPVHNLFLFIVAEIGFLGLSTFLFLLFRVVSALLPALSSSDPLISSSGLGILTGLIAFFAHSQVDYNSWTNFALLWFIFGFAVSVGRIGGLTSRTTNQHAHNPLHPLPSF